MSKLVVCVQTLVLVFCIGLVRLEALEPKRVDLVGTWRGTMDGREEPRGLFMPSEPFGLARQ